MGKSENKYKLIINYVLSDKTYIGYRDGNIFYYDFDSPAGCSSMDVRSKFLISYEKIKPSAFPN